MMFENIDIFGDITNYLDTNDLIILIESKKKLICNMKLSLNQYLEIINNCENNIWLHPLMLLQNDELPKNIKMKEKESEYLYFIMKVIMSDSKNNEMISLFLLKFGLINNNILILKFMHNRLGGKEIYDTLSVQMVNMCYMKNFNIIRYFFENFKEKNNNKVLESVLITSCTSGNMELVNYFCENAGITVDNVKNCTKFILYNTLCSGFVDIIKYLQIKYECFTRDYITGYDNFLLNYMTSRKLHNGIKYICENYEISKSDIEMAIKIAFTQQNDDILIYFFNKFNINSNELIEIDYNEIYELYDSLNYIFTFEI